MCDVAHAALIEQVEQDARAAWIVTAAMAAAGAKVEEMTPADARARVESWLDETQHAGPPPGISQEAWELRVALGVA